VRWSWLIALCGVVAAALALVASSVLPREYESESMLIVGSITETNPTEQLGYQQLAQTYATLAETPIVLRPVAVELGFDLDLEELRENVSADTVTGQSLVRVAARGASPEDAQALAAAVTAQITQLSQTQVDPPENLAVVIEEATLADSASSPSTLVNLLIAAALGILVGVLLAFAFEAIRARRTPAPVLAPPVPRQEWPTSR